MEDPEGASSDSTSLDLDVHKIDSMLDHMGCLIDTSLHFENKEGIELSIKLLEELLKTKLTLTQEGTLYYFMANAWNTLRDLRRTEKSQLWDSEQEVVMPQ
jgi:hypothetical protein